MSSRQDVPQHIRDKYANSNESKNKSSEFFQFQDQQSPDTLCDIKSLPSSFQQQQPQRISPTAHVQIPQFPAPSSERPNRISLDNPVRDYFSHMVTGQSPGDIAAAKKFSEKIEFEDTRLNFGRSLALSTTFTIFTILKATSKFAILKKFNKLPLAMQNLHILDFSRINTKFQVGRSMLMSAAYFGSTELSFQYDKKYRWDDPSYHAITWGLTGAAFALFKPVNTSSWYFTRWVPIFVGFGYIYGLLSQVHGSELLAPAFQGLRRIIPLNPAQLKQLQSKGLGDQLKFDYFPTKSSIQDDKNLGTLHE